MLVPALRPNSWGYQPESQSWRLQPARNWKSGMICFFHRRASGLVGHIFVFWCVSMILTLWLTDWLCVCFQVPAVSGECVLSVEGLVPNQKYVFAVAAYNSQGKLLGNTIGRTTFPLLASMPLPLLSTWAHLAQVHYTLVQTSAKCLLHQTSTLTHSILYARVS